MMLPVVLEWEADCADSKSLSSLAGVYFDQPLTELLSLLLHCLSHPVISSLTQPCPTLLTLTILHAQIPSASRAFEPDLERETRTCWRKSCWTNEVAPRCATFLKKHKLLAFGVQRFQWSLRSLGHLSG